MVMDRTLMLERWLFEAKQAVNGYAQMRPETLRDGLSHCLGADNPAVASEAARMLSLRVVRVGAA